MNKQEVDVLKEALRAEYEKDMAAIERVERLLARSVTPDAPSTTEEANTGTNGDEATLIDAVQQAFAHYPTKRWTVGDIENQLRVDGFKFGTAKPRNSIHTSLTRLEERNAIRIVKRGKGRKPNVYQFVSPERPMTSTPPSRAETTEQPNRDDELPLNGNH